MPKPGTFTAETAHKAAAASVIARAAKAERRFQPASAPLAAPLPTADDYTRLRLLCVREQLAKVDRSILLEASKDHADGQRLNWLAQAQDRLAEQERILAGRPLPGSRRPSASPSPGSQEPPVFFQFPNANSMPNDNANVIPMPQGEPMPIPPAEAPPSIEGGGDK